MVKPLEINPSFTPRRGPVVLAILDGVGFGKYADGDAVKLANTPVLDELMATCPCTKLKAHGTAVGIFINPFFSLFNPKNNPPNKNIKILIIFDNI